MASNDLTQDCKIQPVPADASLQLRRILAENVRRRRLEIGLTQEAAAQEMRVATRHLQKLEAAELNITIETLGRVAAALGVAVAALLSEPDLRKVKHVRTDKG
jgi:transcriptional regulator with XRE-family HTH domain